MSKWIVVAFALGGSRHRRDVVVDAARGFDDPLLTEAAREGQRYQSLHGTWKLIHIQLFSRCSESHS
jgi:hypothetical protein